MFHKIYCHDVFSLRFCRWLGEAIPMNLIQFIRNIRMHSDIRIAMIPAASAVRLPATKWRRLFSAREDLIFPIRR